MTQAQTSENVLTANTIEPTRAEVQRAAPMDPRESAGLIERARQVSRYGLPRQDYRERTVGLLPHEQLQQWEQLHGPSVPVPNRHRASHRRVFQDGSEMVQDSFRGMMLADAAQMQRLDVACNKRTYARVRLEWAQAALKTWQREQLRGVANGPVYSFGALQWDAERLGPPPVDASGRIPSIDRALDRLASLVLIRRAQLAKAEREYAAAAPFGAAEPAGAGMSW